MLRAFTRFLIIALLAFSLVAAAATGDTDDGSSGGSGGGSQTSTGTVDVTKIKSDTEAIGKIGVQLNDALAQDTGEDATTAATINDLATQLNDGINGTTTDLDTLQTPLTEQDATDINTSVQSLADVSDTISSRLVELFPNYVKIGVAETLNNTISVLPTSVDAWGDALVKQTPETISPDTKQMVDKIGKAMQQAADAFAVQADSSSSSGVGGGNGESGGSGRSIAKRSQHFIRIHRRRG